MVEFKGQGPAISGPSTPARTSVRPVHPRHRRSCRRPASTVPSPPVRPEITGSFNQSSSKGPGQRPQVRFAAAVFRGLRRRDRAGDPGKESLRAAWIAKRGRPDRVPAVRALPGCSAVLTFLSLVLAGLRVYGIIVLLGRWDRVFTSTWPVSRLIIGIGMTADSFVVCFETHQGRDTRGQNVQISGPRAAGSARATHHLDRQHGQPYRRRRHLHPAVGEVRGFAFTLGLDPPCLTSSWCSW